MRKFLTSLWRVVSFPFRALWRIVSYPFVLLGKTFNFLNEIPEESQLPDVFSASIQKPSIMMEHINDLRKHLFRILIALVICVAILFVFTPDLIDFLALPIGGLNELVAIDVTESVGVYMRVALMGAVVLASPYIAFELWLFAAPGLMPRAKKFGLLGIPLVLVFFVGGIYFTYKLLLPSALPFLLNFMGVKALPRVSSYINFVTGIMFWIGVAFEFPLVAYILTLMGILQPKVLAKQWRLAIVIIAIAAAVITPTPDPINMSIVMVPLIFLYLISILLSYLAVIGRKREPQGKSKVESM
jgi:sec-independent protein translocase protein TatC